MKKYPAVNDDIFYDKINNIYKKYKIPKDKGNIEKYCNSKEYKLQLPQQFVANFLNPNTPYKSLLIYHRIGSGKTCSAIQIAEKFKNYRRIIFVLPAALKGNLRNELRSLCTGNTYLKENERKNLLKYNPDDEEYKDIINISDERIDQYYDIYSYNKFIELVKDNKISLRNSLLIIDEIQNMVSETGTYYSELYNLIKRSSSNLRVVLLSATPMFDRPVELALTLNLLNLPKEIPLGKEFERKFIKTKKIKDKYFFSVRNMDYFKQLIKGYISYYQGAPSYTFPQLKIKYVNCEMSDFQYSVYKKVLKNEEKNKSNKLKYAIKADVINAAELPNSFYLGARFISNVVFPNKLINDYGFESFTGKKITNNIQKYSCKFHEIINKIKKTKGKVFIYSGFKGYAGLKSLVKVLEEFGYKDYIENGVGKKRFAVWSGDENTETKDEIREIYNRENNLYGKKLKIILGSPSIKEGVSLKAVRQVHIVEPYWNYSRMEQIIGRASRFCSHKDLPEEERAVKVFIYIATHPNEPETVDQYIKKLSDTKNKIIKEFEIAVKEAAIDCHLNKNANDLGDDDIVCEL